MEIKDINKKYDELQNIYGDKNLNAILNGGKFNNPKVCLVFMNPTARNIATEKSWNGLRSPWIGTKNVWTLFYKINMINDNLYHEIRSKKGNEWDEKFASLVYESVTNNEFYITNLAKCSQSDARSLKDDVFRKYLSLFYEEIYEVNPSKIILFGNQVSSIVLDKKINVSNVRKQNFKKIIKDKEFDFYPVYYPVGNGAINVQKAIEDINFIIDS